MTQTCALCCLPCYQVLPTRLTIAVIAAGLISHGTEPTVVEGDSGAARLGFSQLVNVDYFARFAAMVEGIRVTKNLGLGQADTEAALATLQDMDVAEHGSVAEMQASARRAARDAIAEKVADLIATGRDMRSGFADPALVHSRLNNRAAYLTWLPLHC